MGRLLLEFRLSEKPEQYIFCGAREVEGKHPPFESLALSISYSPRHAFRILLES